jgi:hypothetical protein
MAMMTWLLLTHSDTCMMIDTPPCVKVHVLRIPRHFAPHMVATFICIKCACICYHVGARHTHAYMHSFTHARAYVCVRVCIHFMHVGKEHEFAAYICITATNMTPSFFHSCLDCTVHTSVFTACYVASSYTTWHHATFESQGHTKIGWCLFSHARTQLCFVHVTAYTVQGTM